MTIQKVQKGFINFIDNEIVPKSNTKEKFAIASAGVLGLLNIEPHIDNLLSMPMMANSNIWIDESKTEFSLDSFKKIAYTFLDMQENNRYKFEGFKINLPFYQDNLFNGFIIDKNTIDKLMEYIENA